MKHLLNRILQSLTTKITIGIVLCVTMVIVGVLGVLYLQTRRLVRSEAVSHAERVLDNAALRARNYMDEVEMRAADLSLEMLSKAVTAEKSYPHSYTVILDRKGRYLVHPDSAKLLHTTIFDGADSPKHRDLITLGQNMVSGKSGWQRMAIDGTPSIVFYRPLPHTDWSIALVCPKEDIFGRYIQLNTFLILAVLAGLCLMTWFCRKTIGRIIRPLRELARQTRHITDGNYEDEMPRSARNDVIGRMQNSFVDMQKAIREHVGTLQRTHQETTECNEMLKEANQMAVQAESKKTAFIQDVLHQVRTPLNIIQGFVQVLRDDYSAIPEGETNRILDTMQHQAITVTRMSQMLVSASGLNEYNRVERNDSIRCNKAARTAAVSYHQRPPVSVELHVLTSVSDSLRIHTNKDYLSKVLNELLYNAKKFTTEGRVLLRVEASDEVVRFIVEDTGQGIAEAERENIFRRFYKVDGFTEGLGLGLPVCKQLALALGGNLLYDESYAHGSRFILELPKA